jgi:hypothetical protein
MSGLLIERVRDSNMDDNRLRSGQFWQGFILIGGLLGIVAWLLLVAPRSGTIEPNRSGQIASTGVPEGTLTAQVPQAIGSVVYPPPNPVETSIAHATGTAIADLEAIPRATAYAATRTAIARNLLPVKSVDYGSWQYELRQLGGATWINIFYDSSSSVETFQAYVKANKELAEQLAARGDEQEEVTVYFNAISPTQFNSWASTAHVQVKEVRLLTFDTCECSRGSNYNPWFTIYPRAGDPVPLDAEAVAKEVAERQRQYPGVEVDGESLKSTIGLKGVYGAVVVVGRARLSELAADPLPILVEVTPLVVRDELIADGIPGAKYIKVNAPGISYIPLEQLPPE